MVWKPHVTVSSVIEFQGKFLVVEEEIRGKRVFNNPAGHLEEGETLIEAVCRETLEETAYEFIPEAVTGIYLWRKAHNGKTFLRVNFSGTCGDETDQPLDDGIHRALWLSRDELAAEPNRLRSPMVLHCIDDYRAGIQYPLDVLTHVDINDET